MIDFDFLRTIYKLAPIEAIKFEQFFKADLKHGQLSYLESICDVIETNFIDYNQGNYVNEMIKRTVSNKSFVRSRIGSVRG